MEATPADPLVDRAYSTYTGMRLVQDPFFPCLVTFICSAQMRVRRIFRMQRDLAQEYGEPVAVDGQTYYAYPPPERLATVPEAELRELKLGYRAPYVKQTAQLVASGEMTIDDIPTDYEAARAALTEYVGVGEKVADCVCLFSLGHLEAVPLDTSIRRAIHDYYPDCDQGSYSATSRAIREQFGSFAGYAQTYVFHYLRHNDSVD
jgi:N-glycosylase/DNA lyase